MAVGTYVIQSLAENPRLSEGVKRQLRLADWQMFIVTMTVLVGGGLMLSLPAVSHDAQLAAAGFVGAVVSYFFGSRLTTTSAAATIAAQQATNGVAKPTA